MPETAEFIYNVCVGLSLCIFVGCEARSCYCLLIDRKCHNTKSVCSSYLAYTVGYTCWTRVCAHMQAVYDLWLKPSRASVWVCVSLNELWSYVEVCVSVCVCVCVCVSQPARRNGCPPIRMQTYQSVPMETWTCAHRDMWCNVQYMSRHTYTGVRGHTRVRVRVRMHTHTHAHTHTHTHLPMRRWAHSDKLWNAICYVYEWWM